MDAIVAGSTDQTIYFRLRDSTTGLAKTNLTFESAGNSCYYTLNRGIAVQIPLVTLTAADSPHADGGFKEVDGTNAKGLYRLDLSDAAVPAGSRTVCVSIEFDGVIEETKEIYLDIATQARLLSYIQLSLRSDPAIFADNATELSEINANEGSGAGDYANTTDSQEAIRASSVGLGDTPVNHNYGGTDALAYTTPEGAGIDDALVRAYLAADWEAGNRGNAYVVGQTRTTAAGRWEQSLMLDPENYVILYYAAGKYGPDLVSLTVE